MNETGPLPHDGLLPPEGLLIGAPKCGTTALAAYLAEHPRIAFARPKEPHFFADDLPGLRIPPDEAAYRRSFPVTGATTLAMEGSVWYLYSRTAVAGGRGGATRCPLRRHAAQPGEAGAVAAPPAAERLRRGHRRFCDRLAGIGRPGARGAGSAALPGAGHAGLYRDLRARRPARAVLRAGAGGAAAGAVPGRDARRSRGRLSAGARFPRAARRRARDVSADQRGGGPRA